MPRILHVLDHSLPLHSGYTFRTRAILKAQQSAGWDISGITGLRQYQHGHRPDAAFETIEGLRFHRTATTVSAPSPLREWREVTALADAIVALHAKWPFEILHAHSPALNGLAALRASRVLGVPLLYEIRAFWEDAAVGNGTGTEGSFKYRLTRTLENYVVRQADAVAVICDGLKQDLIRRGIAPSKITVTPNGVDFEMFGTTVRPDVAFEQSLGLRGANVIGYIGSFYDYEGIDVLIDAMPLMNNQAHLLLVGGGPMERSLRAQSEGSPVADRIHFAGRVRHDAVDRYYGLVDILAYPRKRMRLTELVTPLKPLEAMAQGRLVAASDVGGHHELIRNGDTGTLFPADNPAALALSLDNLLRNKNAWEPMQIRARAFVKQERNWQAIIRRYDPVYNSLLMAIQGASAD
ncbi:TIGR04063 family PEP-CTERM/XrtA system glycosyltransferase [Sphingorhabdus sp.]|uniref:TIGR04063 family PEP-CTERM/XrtA system glycosyltransferase n=1 Tax=Sphingorhabdus sp. TaxID=1902408 RepID=UPI00391AB8DA